VHDTNQEGSLLASNTRPGRPPFSPLARRGAIELGALLTLVWIPLGALAAHFGFFARLPPPMIPAFVLSGTLAMVLWYRRSRSLNAFAWSVPLAVPILFHVLRAAIGADFLRLYGEGALPAGFALHAGIGDIIAGVGALAVLLPLRGATRRHVLMAWNIVAFADIAGVVVTAQVEVFTGDELLRAAFSHAPYGAIPFLLVLVFATHLLIFARLRREKAEAV